MSQQNSYADRNLLFGIFAWQNGLISESQLLAAMKEWTFQKSNPIGAVLVEQGVLTDAACQRLDQMIELHIAMHGGDAAASLASVRSATPAVKALGEIDDPDVDASLGHVAATVDSESPNLLPTTLGISTSEGTRFRILRPHAKGGLGEVFVARDEELNRDVALKEIQSHSGGSLEARSRFRMEAEVTGQLEHPGIVPVYGLGNHADGRPFYAMRFVRGENLKQAIGRFHESDMTDSERRLAFRELLRRFVDICDAMEYAHSRGVLHRDLKPGNVMLGKFGETLVVDWGLARVAGKTDDSESRVSVGPVEAKAASDVTPTQDGSVMGTYEYMSPEQAAGRLDELGPATDVYALGAMLYEILTGKPPIERIKNEQGKFDAGETLRSVIEGRIKGPRSIRRDAPKALSAISMKALSVSPSDRYRTAHELAGDVERWLADEPIEAWKEPVIVRARRWMRKHQTLTVSTFAAMLILTCSLVVIVAVVESMNVALTVAEKEATEEAAIAKAVNDFLHDDLLGQASPFWEPDRDIKLRTVLDNASKSIESRFPDQPLVEAAIRQTLADTYDDLGEYDLAEEHEARALELRRINLGKEHPDTLESMHSLAGLYASLGRYEEAETLYEKTLEIRKRVLGEEHDDTLSTMNNIAVLYESQGRYEEAETLLETTLEIQKRVLGEDDLYTSGSMGKLSTVYMSQGRNEEAEPLLEKMLEDEKRWLGEEHPSTLTSMSNLACLYDSLGRSEEAETLFEKTLEIRKRVLGEEHPSTLTSMSNLACLYDSLGRSEEAETLFEKTLEIQKRVLGEEHPSTLTSMSNLACLYDSLGRSEEAETLFEKTLEIQKRVLGEEHPSTLASMGILSSKFSLQDRYDEAETLYEKTLEIQKRVLGEEHPDTLDSMVCLAVLIKSQGRNEEAEELFEKTLEMQKRVLGDEHPNTLGSMNNLADLYESLGRFEDAETLYEKTLEIQKRVLGEEHPDTLDSMVCLAVLIKSQGRNEEAEELFEKTLEIQKRVLGEEHPKMRLSMGTLALLYMSQARYEEAEPLLEKTLEIEMRVRGKDHRGTNAIEAALAEARKAMAEAATQKSDAAADSPPANEE